MTIVIDSILVIKTIQGVVFLTRTVPDINMKDGSKQGSEKPKIYYIMEITTEEHRFIRMRYNINTKLLDITHVSTHPDYTSNQWMPNTLFYNCRKDPYHWSYKRPSLSFKRVSVFVRWSAGRWEWCAEWKWEQLVGSQQLIIWWVFALYSTKSVNFIDFDSVIVRIDYCYHYYCSGSGLWSLYYDYPSQINNFRLTSHLFFFQFCICI